MFDFKKLTTTISLKFTIFSHFNSLSTVFTPVDQHLSICLFLVRTSSKCYTYSHQPLSVVTSGSLGKRQRLPEMGLVNGVAIMRLSLHPWVVSDGVNHLILHGRFQLVVAIKKKYIKSV